MKSTRTISTGTATGRAGQYNVGLSRLLMGLLLAGVAASSAFAAAQTEEEAFQEVETKGNWEYTIDVSDREPGLYNILVRARDEAGNVSLGGPYNVIVDPESDRPITSISYPQPNQAVGRRLFAVGTAQDDDSVKYVEVQINEAPPVRADGTDYWSALLTLDNLEDGVHTIRVRAFDENDVEGNLSETSFRLDTTQPVASATSHESGVLISRRTTISGTVDDANGVSSLVLYNGETRSTLRLRGGRDELPRFEFEIDPRDLEDGAYVWWLESEDRTGARGVTPFLFFVDTSPPELAILSPSEEDRVDAQLRFIGTVSDLVGVLSLDYELSTGETGSIPLTPGDPYWSLAVDLPAGSRGNVNATFTVTDVAENVRSERVRLAIDSAGDLPVVSIISPAEGDFAGSVLSGHISDDDTGAAVIYTVDGGEEQRVDLPELAGEGFAVPLPDLAPGNHEIRIRAIDTYGNEGDEIRRRFRVATPLPSISLTEVVRGETVDAYEPGFAIAANERVTVAGQVSAASGSTALPSRLNFFAGATGGNATVDATGRFTFAMPRSTEGGPVAIEIIYQNEAGSVSRTVGFATQLPEVEEGATAPSVASLLPRGLLVSAGDIVPDADLPAPGDFPILLGRGEQLPLFATQGRPSDATIEPAVDFLSVRTSGNTVVVSATGDGSVTGLRVSATVGGSTVASAPLSIRTEASGPSIELPSELVGRRFAEIGQIQIEASDASGVTAVETSVAFVPAEGEEPGSTSGQAAELVETEFVATPRLPSGDGAAILSVTATDASGVASRILVPIVLDRTPPALDILTPSTEDTINGTITLQGLLTDPAHVILAQATTTPPEREAPAAEPTTQTESADAETETGADTSDESATTDDTDPAGAPGGPAGPTIVDLGIGSLITYQVASGDTDGRVTINLSDSAGNTSQVAVNLRTDEAADLPVLELQVPTEGGLVQQEFRVSGVLLDDDAPQSVTFTIDDGEPITRDTDGTFDVDVSMADLADGDHTITIFGTDLEGVQSEPITRTFAISRSQPITAMSAPGIETFQRGIVQLVGTSADPNDVDLVEISTDNSASFQGAIGTTEWGYRLDTTLMDDGTHSILVRATDGAGETSLLSTTINVDNTPPLLELTEPSDGVSVSGSFIIDGRGDDAALEVVRLVAQPLGDDGDDSPAASPIELAEFSTTGPFAYEVNTTTLPTGWYNLRVEARDLAGNTNRISRNLLIQPASVQAAPEILVPPDGASLSHQFTVTVAAAPGTSEVTLLANDRPVTVIPLAPNGVGSVLVEPGTIPAGEVTLVAQQDGADDEGELLSVPHVVTLAELGPWITVGLEDTDVPFMSFVRDRPFLTGRAGYEIPLPEGEDRDTERARREILDTYAIERIEVSLDNGRSFSDARGAEEWQYRIETTELTDGQHNLVVRAVFANGESAVVRHAVVVDGRPPEVRLLEPQERGTFDESIRIVGVTTDENPLQDIAVVIREGDKARYAVPSFIQGLYIDAHALGATYFDIGAGLTFFDDNVRLQAQVGVAPPGRFSGLVMGAKLLANIASFPASFFFGPDLQWLSAALALGANFSYFTMSDEGIGFTDEGLVLAGMLAQLEFPIVSLPDLPVFNTFSLYTEAQLWFISSDVEAGTAFRLGFGVRTNVF